MRLSLLLPVLMSLNGPAGVFSSAPRSIEVSDDDFFSEPIAGGNQSLFLHDNKTGSVELSSDFCDDNTPQLAALYKPYNLSLTSDDRKRVQSF